jgi:hypothetical protein
MPTAAQCYADYKKCLGTNPSQSQQVACTFAYIQCILHGAEAIAVKELKRFEKEGGVKTAKTTRKRRRSGRGKQ